MFVGDEYGLVSVLKYDPDGEQLLQLHYELSSESLAEATGVSISNRQPIVSILPQPYSSAKDQEAGLSPNVVNLQLSSAEKRLPVIVLHWLDGRSEEVVTVLTLEWSSGMETLRCISRMDLTLAGSFADMILIPSAELFHVYGRIEGLESKTAAVSSTLTLTGNKKWPLIGGVSNHLSFGKDNTVHRLYVAGYQDGSVRIWDATYPVFSLFCILKNEVNGEKLVGSGASLTVLELCPSTLRLAVGS
ncbi:hypothetical protein ACS0TY_022067 [Phlomoides rotata]